MVQLPMVLQEKKINGAWTVLPITKETEREVGQQHNHKQFINKEQSQLSLAPLLMPQVNQGLHKWGLD